MLMLRPDPGHAPPTEAVAVAVVPETDTLRLGVQTPVACGATAMTTKQSAHATGNRAGNQTRILDLSLDPWEMPMLGLDAQPRQ
jgi:hypothetical protein